MVFFFQAEDGIRDLYVTGVQTCALPISYSFQGLKEKGLQLLAEARDATGLAVVTEVMAPEHIKLVATYADVLQVGARNMQNYPLLEAAGESGLPVFLDRKSTRLNSRHVE